MRASPSASVAEQDDEKEREERYEESIQGLQIVLWYFKERCADQAEREGRRHGTVPDVCNCAGTKEKGNKDQGIRPWKHARQMNHLQMRYDQYAAPEQKNKKKEAPHNEPLPR